MFVTRNVLLRFRSPAGEGTDLPGAAGADDSTGGDYGDDFTPTGDDALGVDDAGAAAGDDAGDDDVKADDSGDKGEDLRNAADVVGDGDDTDAKSTGTPKTGKGKFIPFDRHEKLLKKEREKRQLLEAQLAQGQAGQQVARANATLETIENELVSMEEQYNELLAEGDTKGAAKLMTDIRRKNAQLNAATAEQRDAAVMAQAVEKVRYDEALERIETEYPQLDPDSDEYDEDVFQDVVDLMQAGQRRGLSPTKALQRAVARTMGAETAAQKRVTTVTPRVDEKEIIEKDAAAERRSAAVKRNLAVAGKQPPATHKVGQGNDAAGGAITAQTVMKMSEAEFEKLPDDVLAKLRGDTV